MINRPTSIIAKEDIPLPILESLQQSDLFSSNENIFLLIQKSAGWPVSLFQRNLEKNGTIITNLRVFEFIEFKLDKYIFLNDIRTSRYKKGKKGWKMEFHTIDGNIREFYFSNRSQVVYLQKLIQAIKNLNLKMIEELIASQRATLRNIIHLYLKENTPGISTNRTLMQNLFHIPLQDNESTEEAVIRYAHQRKGWSKIEKIWEPLLPLNKIIKMLEEIATLNKLKIPGKMK